MKKILSIVAVMLCAQLSYAQDDNAAAMEAWMKYMQPGDMHKMLANYSGKWDAEITHWMAPGAPPMKQKSSMVCDMYLGDRYQRMIYDGDFQGMPFHGEGLTAYDNAKKVFVSTWIDNMGTGIMYTEGTWNPETKSIEYTGSQTDPMTGKDIQVREVLTLSDKDTQKMEMYMTHDGQEMKTMEILLKRKG